MGNDTKNIIEINGKRYNATSGAFLGDSPAAVSAKPAIHSVRHRTIDGFTRVSRDLTPKSPQKLTPTPAVKKPVAPAPITPKPAAHPATHAVHHKPHSHGFDVAPHKPQHAATLMRSAVKKPVIKSPAHIKAQTRTDLLARVPQQTVAPKISYSAVNPIRKRRAERMIQSPAVSRYSSGAAVGQGTAYRIAPNDRLVSRPAVQYAGAKPQHSAALPTDISRPTPVSNRGTAHPGAVHQQSSASNAHMAHPRPAHKLDIFEQALADATGHEQTYEPAPKARKKRGRTLRYLTGSLVALFLIGFLAYQNLPNLSMQLASHRAGLHATLPAQRPAGFTFGYLDYSTGNVTINFTSPHDSRQFNITQKASDWDSQALLSNFVASANTAYKTYSRAGRTVYVLGNNTATWVDSGIWYTVDGNSSLSSGQLLDLASSM